MFSLSLRHDFGIFITEAKKKRQQTSCVIKKLKRVIYGVFYLIHDLLYLFASCAFTSFWIFFLFLDISESV